MTEQSTFLTPAALEKLKRELEELKTNGREEIEKRIAEARSHGDIRENADYDAAKNEQGLNEARIRQIEQILKTAVIIEGGSSGDVVEPGCLVELKHEGDDTPETYLVGSIEERHETYPVLSTSSPLGQALLGAAPGTTVTYQGPRRELSVTVLGIRTLD